MKVVATFATLSGKGLLEKAIYLAQEDAENPPALAGWRVSIHQNTGFVNPVN